MNKLFYIASIILLVFAGTVSCGEKLKEPNSSFDSTIYLNYQFSINHLVDSLELDQKDLFIYIDKSDFILSVKTKDQTIKEYPVVLGTNPIDDKRMEGDRCTPEGVFHIRDHYPHKSWNKFIWIDYPNEESWRKFNEAKEQGLIPKDATIGGEVGIHGVPKGKDYLIDNRNHWTWGCISLKNNDVEDLYSVVFNGMKIEIH